MKLFTRAIRPPDDVTPNPNDPASVPPATVGPPSARPGDPHGVVLDMEPRTPSLPPPTIWPSAWSGWPADWFPPYWDGHRRALGDTAWACLDLNASVLASMPPYLVNAAGSLDADWLVNPEPDVYASWDEFAKQLFWDFQLGEAFVLTTARYATGWPARFHVVPGYLVNVELRDGRRTYSIGSIDVTGDMLHIRYQSQVGDAHGHGPLEAGGARLTAADVLTRYATNLAAGGGIPPSVLETEDLIGAEQAANLKAQWVNARMSSIGEPAVLEGGVKWTPTQLDPVKMALIELLHFNESRIATLLGVPPFLVGLPAGGDSMTYKNVSSIFDYHWRAGLRPKATAVMGALSGWALPRGTTVEVNRDEYTKPELLERAQAYKILSEIGALSIDEIRAAERLDDTEVYA